MINYSLSLKSDGKNENIFFYLSNIKDRYDFERAITLFTEL